jgi:hypothetical protein
MSYSFPLSLEAPETVVCGYTRFWFVEMITRKTISLVMPAILLAASITLAQPSASRLIPIDAATAFAVQAVEVDGSLSEATSQSLRAYGASLVRVSQPSFEILIIASMPVAGEDETVSMRRAVLVREELARASFLPRERFVLQVSRQVGLKSHPQETSIVIQPVVRQQSGAEPRSGARYVWAPDARRFVIVCADGYLPANHGVVAWPDDFAAFRNCPQTPSEPVSRERMRVDFDGTAGRWFLACPDGEPLRARAGDLDDFSASRRCNR